MDEIREQKIQVVQMMTEYLQKLIPSMEQVVSEIKGEQQEDTIDFLMQVIDGLNFMIESYNVVEDVINADGSIVKDDIEKSVSRLSDGFYKKDYVKIADELDVAMIPILKSINDKAFTFA